MTERRPGGRSLKTAEFDGATAFLVGLFAFAPLKGLFQQIFTSGADFPSTT